MKKSSKNIFEFLKGDTTNITTYKARKRKQLCTSVTLRNLNTGEPTKNLQGKNNNKKSCESTLKQLSFFGLFIDNHDFDAKLTKKK